MRPILNIDCVPSELSEEAIYSAEVLQECYVALDEGVDNPEVLKTAHHYAKGLLIMVLDMAYKMLCKLLTNMLKVFNAYIVNDVRLTKKYQKIIFSKMATIKEPIHYTYYSYEGLYEYPKEINQSVADTKDIIDAMKSVKKNEAPGKETLVEFTSKKIRTFAESVVGDKIDPDDIQTSVKSVIYHNVRGRKTSRTLTYGNLKEFYSDMERTVKEKKRIYALKNQITSYYQVLKSEIDKIYRDADKKDQTAKNPNFREANIKIDNINGNITPLELQRNRLINAYISIYRSAFSAKIDIIREKIELDSGVIAEIFKKSSIFATMVRT